MEESSNGELIFIPWPVMGHVQIVEFANLIIHRQKTISPGTRKLSVTLLLMKLPDYVDTVSGSFLDKLTNDPLSPRVNFFHLPSTEAALEWSSKTRGYFIHNLVLSQRSNVAEFVRSSNAVSVVVDMLCTSMIDVAEEFNIPSYVFFTSPANFLGAMLHFQVLHDEKNQDVCELKQIPSLANPFPPEALPLVLVEKELWLDRFLHCARFSLRSIHGLADIPGWSDSKSNAIFRFRSSEIIQWLDEQPPRSVVLVCFGSQGSLHADQVKELSHGLELSGHRFLWALRRQSPNEKRAVFPSEYISHAAVLPDGFLDRTSRIGKVVGWVPQLDVLSHESVGGFVSHCGWNSVLESVWCGVPIATWPLHAEQQMNAFQVASDLGLGVEIALSYHEGYNDGEMVKRFEVERRIGELMDAESEARKRMKMMSEKSRICVMEGGSSYIQLGRLITNFLLN